MEWYANAQRAMANAETDFDDGMIFTLHGSGYSLDRFVHDYVNDLTSELATGGGYTNGGQSAGVVSRTLTVANSWSVQRAASTAYAAGDVVRPAAANGFLYRATNAGTTAAGLPTYPVILGQTVVDGGLTWECYGRAITVFTAASPPTWAAPFTATGIRYVVLSDRTAGLTSAQALIGVTDLGSDQAGGGGAWGITPHAALGLLHIVHH